MNSTELELSWTPFKRASLLLAVILFYLCFQTQTKQAEKEAILEGIERNGADASQKVIQSVLEKRHKKVFVTHFIFLFPYISYAFMF